MENIILHSTPLKDFQVIIGDIVEAKLRQFKQEQPTQAPGEYITRREVCHRLKISLATLHSYTKDGTLNGYRIGGRVLYRLAEVEQSIQAIKTVKYKHGRG
jgi:excisionase family DNA binding protein